MERTSNKSQHTKLTLEKKVLPPLLPGFKLATFRTSPALYQLSYLEVRIICEALLTPHNCRFFAATKSTFGGCDSAGETVLQRQNQICPHLTYLLTEGVVGAPQMTSQPVSFIVLHSPLPSVT